MTLISFRLSSYAKSRHVGFLAALLMGTAFTPLAIAQPLPSLLVGAGGGGGSGSNGNGGSAGGGGGIGGGGGGGGFGYNGGALVAGYTMALQLAAQAA